MKSEYSEKNTKLLQQLSFPATASHKGQNGRMLLIGGSHLFHAASLWALTVASRIVDLVHYASVPENNEIAHEAKSEFRNGIVIPRREIENYIIEDDAILIGPGMNRASAQEVLEHKQTEITSIAAIEDISNEGVQTYFYTNYLFKKYPKKQWVLDAGALQMVDVENIPFGSILTPHAGEFQHLRQKINGKVTVNKNTRSNPPLSQVVEMATIFHCVILAKGIKDIIVDGRGNKAHYTVVSGGNAGLTKGGTGDVLAGLVTALATKHDPFIAAVAGSMINKIAGDELFQMVGPYFNSTDLTNQIPKTMYSLLKKTI